MGGRKGISPTTIIFSEIKKSLSFNNDTREKNTDYFIIERGRFGEGWGKNTEDEES